MNLNVVTNGNFILYQTEDGQTRIEVRLQDESVWLAQATFTELFQTSKQNISLHLKNIFAVGGGCRKIESSRNTWQLPSTVSNTPALLFIGIVRCITGNA